MPRRSKSKVKSQNASVGHTEIALDKKRKLVASFSHASTASREWLVYLPESGAGFLSASRKELSSLVGAHISRRLHFLVINKTGVGPNTVNRTEFENSFRRPLRIRDALTAIRKIVPTGDSIHLVGYSEGAYLAPQVAGRERRVVSMTLIGGGTRGWLKEELANAHGAEKKAHQTVIREILQNPTARKRWNGFSYATWYSYRGDHTLFALRRVGVPTLAILGARDRVIDLRAAIADLMLVSRHQPIELHILEDCGHRFTRHWRQVNILLTEFLGRV